MNIFLRFKAPWSVNKVDLSLEVERVIVVVVLKQGRVQSDPAQSTKPARINSWLECEWRYFDAYQFEIFIQTSVA